MIVMQFRHMFLFLTTCIVAILGDHSLESTKVTPNAEDLSNVTNTTGFTGVHGVVDPTSIEGSSRVKRSDKEVEKVICYSCLHQAANPMKDCLDPFYEFDIPAVSCKGICVKSKWRTKDGEVYKISRACWSGKCVENSTDTLTRTCCRSNHCNAAVTNRRSIFDLPMMMMMAIVAFFIL